MRLATQLSKPKKISNGVTATSPALAMHDKLFGLRSLSLLLLAATLFVFTDFLLLEKLYLFKDIGSDSINDRYPRLVHLADYLRSDGIPGWSFTQGMGQDLFPFSLGNPFDLVLLLMGRERIAMAIVYVEVGKILIAGFLFYAYLRKLSALPVVATVGALSFAFSGFVVLGGQWHVFSTEAVHLALLLYSTERVLSKPREAPILYTLTIAVIAAFQPFNLFVFGVLLLTYLMFRQFFLTELTKHDKFNILGKLFGFGALGVSMSALFLLPNCLQLLQSPRVSGDASYADALLAFPIFEFAESEQILTATMRLLSTDAMGTGSHYNGWSNYLEAPLLYVGTLTLLLFPQAFNKTGSREKRIFASVLTLALLLILFPSLRHLLWLFTGDYYRIYGFASALALLSLGLIGLQRIILTRTVSIPLLLISMGALILIVSVSASLPSVNMNHRALATTGLLAVCYTLLLGCLGTAKFVRSLNAALLIALTCELAMMSSTTVNNRPALMTAELKARRGFNDYSIEALRLIEENDAGFYRAEKDFSSGPALHASLNDAKMQRYYGTTSYHRYNQGAYIRFLSESGVIDGSNEIDTRWSPGLRYDPLLMNLVSVKYLLSQRDYLNNRQIMHTYDAIAGVGPITVLRNRHFLGLGLHFGQILPLSEFRKLSRADKSVALFNALVVEDEDLIEFSAFTHYVPVPGQVYDLNRFKENVNSLAIGELQELHFTNKAIRGNLSLEDDALIMLSIPFDEGWSATLNQQEVKLFQVHGGLTGFILPGGDQAIELAYTPPGMRLGAAITVLSLLLYFLLIARSAGKRKSAEPH